MSIKGQFNRIVLVRKGERHFVLASSQVELDVYVLSEITITKKNKLTTLLSPGRERERCELSLRRLGGIGEKHSCFRLTESWPGHQKT